MIYLLVGVFTSLCVLCVFTCLCLCLCVGKKTTNVIIGDFWDTIDLCHESCTQRAEACRQVGDRKKVTFHGVSLQRVPTSISTGDEEDKRAEHHENYTARAEISEHTGLRKH